MFEDDKDPSIKAESKNFGIADLRKAYATQSTSHIEVVLCYSGVSAYVKPIKIKDKKDILKSIETKNDNLLNRALDDIIEKYVEFQRSEPIDINKITQKEKEQILVYIRLAAGDDIKTVNIIHQCPECQKITKDIPFAVDAISVKNYDKSAGKEVVELPGNIKIKMGPVTIADEKEIDKLTRDKKQTSSLDKQLATVAALMKEVAVGDSRVSFKSLDEKVSFLSELQSGDMDKITSYISQYDFGITLPFHFKCSHCEYEGDEEANSGVFFMS